MMNRRSFLTHSLAAGAALSVTDPAQAQTSNATREFYLLRRYSLRSGYQAKLMQAYFAEALVPALNRLGHTPVGVFSAEYGPQVPEYYTVIPGATMDVLATLDERLNADAEFQRAAAPVWAAPASSPAFERVETSLLHSFVGYPRLTPPAKGSGKKFYHLRTYEGASMQDYYRKLEMFHSGEFAIFARAGVQSVFYGDTLVGPRQPSLTYMLAFASIDELNTQWAAFFADPEWKKLSASQRFAFEAIVSNVGNMVLNPMACSQI